MIVRKTRPEESQRVNELFAIAFEFVMDSGPADPENSRVHHWAAFEDDDREMMSNFTISDYQILFDGSSCKMGGIGGVATLPQYRRRGGIRGCFNHALPDMYQNGYDFSYLYPFSTAYYRKFGYENCVQRYLTTVNLSLLNPEPVNGYFRLAEKHTPMTEQIRSIDRVWESRYNMTVIHEDEDYEWTKQADPAKKQEFTYVWFNSQNKPKAYTTFLKKDEPDGRNLVCKRFFYTDREGYYGLLQVFKSLASDHTYAKFPIPANTSMQYLMPEWSLGAASWALQSAGMARVINVKNVLSKTKYIGSGEITLQIMDPQIAENNRTFSISFKNGRAVTVSETDNCADAVLTIQAFSALICGVCNFYDAVQWMTGITIHHKDACFDRIFYTKPMMITDYF